MVALSWRGRRACGPGGLPRLPVSRTTRTVRSGAPASRRGLAGAEAILKAAGLRASGAWPSSGSTTSEGARPPAKGSASASPPCARGIPPGPHKVTVLLDRIPRGAQLPDQRQPVHPARCPEQRGDRYLRRGQLRPAAGRRRHRDGSCVVVYVAPQRYYVRGLVSGALKAEPVALSPQPQPHGYGFQRHLTR